MNIAIIGSGAIGLTIASELSRISNCLKLTIFSDEDCTKTASKASGAMINIVSEVDYINRSHPLTSLKLDRYDELMTLWQDFSSYICDEEFSLLQGEGTEVRCHKESINELELLSFDSILSATNEYGIDHILEHENSLKSLFLPHEKSVDSNSLLDKLSLLLSSNEKIFFETCAVSSLVKNRYGWKVLLDNGKQFQYDYILICAGSFSEKIINNSNDINKPNIKSFFGVGSALNLYSELPYVHLPRICKIIRTPNRGGTCGIHILERDNSLYIGASSFINPEPINGARSSSLMNLLQGANEFLNINIEKLSCDVLTGFRPVTSDACPIIGELDENLYCIYGTKRDGLTWAPYYSYNISREILKMNTMNSWRDFKLYCYPYREYNSAGSIEHCSNSYILSKKYEALQHNKVLDDNELNDLSNIASIVHRDNFQGKGIYPELINMFYFGHAITNND